MLQQIRYVSSDEPSALLLDGLRKVAKNIEIMLLDPTHLAIVYEYATWRKRTPGSKLLRRMMRKFAQHDSNLDASAWGVPYEGTSEAPLTRQEEMLRARVLTGGMPLTRARMVLAQMNDDKPWYTRIDFIEGIAALTALYWDEVQRKVTGPHPSVPPTHAPPRSHVNITSMTICVGFYSSRSLRTHVHCR